MPDLGGSSHPRKPLPGRRAELDLIARELDLARDGEPRFILVAGETGVGKTRLLREAVRQADDMRPLGLFIRREEIGVEDLLEHWFAPLIQDLLGRKEMRLDLALAAAIYPRLADLSPIANLPPTRNESPQRALAAIGRLLSAATDKSPVVLLLDDVPRLQPDALRFIAELASSLIDAPLAYLATARTELGDQLAERSLAPLLELHLLRRIDLEPLDEAGLQEMATAELDSHVATLLAPWLLERSRGNPLFASELLQALRSQKILHQDAASGEWRLTKDLDELRLPDTLADLLERRRHGLPFDLAGFVPALALLGADAPAHVLAHAIEIDEAMIQKYRTELEDRGILVRSDESHEFAHPLLGEHWATKVAVTERSVLAGRATSAALADIEKRQNYRPGLVDGSCRTGLETGTEVEIRRLFSYAEEARRPTLQVLAAIELGRRCLVGRRPRDAASWVRLANRRLRRVADHRERRWLSTQIDHLMGSALYLATRLGAAERRLRRFLAAPESRDPEQGPTAFRYLGLLHSKAGRFDEARDVFEAGLDAFNSPDFDPTLSMVIRSGFINHLTMSELKRGDLAAATALVERGFQILGDSPPPEAGKALAQLLSARGLLASTRGEYRSTVADKERVLELSRLHVPHAVPAAQSNLSMALVMIGELSRARTLAAQSLRLSEDENRTGQASVYYALAYAQEAAGEWNSAIRSYEKSLRLCEQTGHDVIRSSVLAGLLSVYEAIGDHDRSDQMWVRLLPYLQDPDAQSHQLAPLYLVRATALARRCDWDAVLHIVTECFAPLAQSCSPRDQAAFEILAVQAELKRSIAGGLGAEPAPQSALAAWSHRLDMLEPYLRGEGLRDHLIDIARVRLHLAIAGWGHPPEAALSEILQHLTAMEALARLAEVADEFVDTAIGALPLFKLHFLPARSRVKEPPDSEWPEEAPHSVQPPRPQHLQMLRIHTFGPLRVLPPQHSSTLRKANWSGSRKGRDLLAFLLVRELDGRGATRDQICDAVWGRTADSTNRFHIALNRLRNALRGDKSMSKPEQHYIVHEDGVYSLIDTGIWCDVREFDRLLKRADKEKQAKAALRLRRTAFDLYEGDFLAGLEHSWVEAYRESYRQRFAHTGAAIAEAALTEGHFEDAVQIAQKMIACDPEEIDGHRLLITTYVRTGHRKEAKEQLDRSRRLFSKIGDRDAVVELEALLDNDESSARRGRKKPNL